MWKKIVFAVVSIAVLAAAVYFYIHIREVKTPISSAIKAVPTDACIIFESRQTRGTWKKLSQSNIMWSDLIGTDFIAALNRDGNTIDSLLALDTEASKLLENKPVIISMHKTGENALDFLYLYSLPDITQQPTAEQFIVNAGKTKAPAQRQFEGVSINTIIFANRSELHFAFTKGILIAGFNVTLVENSIKQLNSGRSLQDDKYFSSVLQSAGQKVDGNIYVNYKQLPFFFSGFLSADQKDLVNDLSGFASWTEVDATIRPNELMLSGFTSFNDSIHNYLGLFREQDPQNIELTSIAPSNTSSFVFFGLSDFNVFYTNYKEHLGHKGKRDEHDRAVTDINTRYGIDAEKSMLSWIGNEMAMIVTEPSSTDFEDKCYAVFRSADIEETKKLLDAISDSAARVSETKQDTENFQGYSIHHLMIPGLIPALLGSPFEHVQQNYYTNVGNYMVFGNSIAAIKQIINSYEGGKTLENDQYYVSFAENNLSEDASLYVYSNIARSPNLYKAYASAEHTKDIDKFMDIYRRFQAIGIQFSSNGKQFYSNIFLKHNPIYKQETNSLWEVPLDTTVSNKPVLVTNHNTKAKDIFVQDDGNNIYLISNTGKLLWSRQLDEKIMSEVVQVDGLRNGKLQVMFNTRSAIYVIDRNGKDLQGFPVKLKSPASNGMTVLDYENNADYRLLIACENKRLLNLKMNGQMVDGWNFDKTENLVNIPVQYHNIGGKDHLFAVDSKGKVYVLDRHGNPRVKVKEDIGKPVSNFFIEPGRDIARSTLVAADSTGNIIRLILDGNKEAIKLGEFSSSPVFDLKDMNNDKQREYILMDSKSLSVYRQDRSLVFRHQFSDTVSLAKPMFFLFPDNSGRIGAASPSANEVYLFGPAGELHPGFPLTGSSPFSIGRLNDDEMIYLVTASGKTVYVYVIEQ
jgi:hypothetical protein